MNNIYKIAIVVLLTIIGFEQTSRATDLIVAPGGAGGTYASLNAAIAAASANDRIIVTPQSGSAAYTEGTITITKSLQILSTTEGTYYTIDGNINVTPSTAGISLTITGMKLLTGGIQSTIASPTGARGVINLLNDSLAAGTVDFNHDNYNLTCGNNYIENGITFRFGKILGNVVRSRIAVNTDASTNNLLDTVQIIGNKITYYSSSNLGAVSWASTSQFFSIQNNFIFLSYPSNSVNYGIWSTVSKASLAGTNTVINNTIYKPTYTLGYGIPLNTNATSYTEVYNNLIVSTIYQYAYTFSGGNFNVHYNYATNFNFNGVTNDGTNTTATNTTVNTDGAITNVLSNAINGGSPDAFYDDINLSRNDAGCYGGSYTLDNFFPFTAGDWARVLLVSAPRRVLVNGTISVKAVGYDK